MPKVLCLLVHFYSRTSVFEGKSKLQDENIRHDLVSRAIFSLKSVNFVDLNVCGYDKDNIVSIDIDMKKNTADPRLMIYEAICLLRAYRSDYDYFMVVEDDILVNPDIFKNVFSFDEVNSVTEIFHPNRIEVFHDKVYCIDTKVLPGTLGPKKKFKNRELSVYKNPHSGIFLVNRDKLDYLIKNIDFSYRGQFIGGYMASAFAHFHKPFNLFRVSDGLDFHTIQHLDRYEMPSASAYDRIKSIVNRVSFPNL